MNKFIPSKITAAFSLVLFLMLAASENWAFCAEKSNFADIVQKDAWFYLQNFPVTDKNTENFPAKLLASPEMQEVLNPLKKYIKGMDSLAAMMTGISPAETLKNTSGNMGFAVIKTRAGRPGIFCWIDLETEIENFKKNLPGIESFLSDKVKKSIETVKIGDFTLKAVPLGATRLAWLTKGSNLLFGEFNYLKDLVNNNFEIEEPLSKTIEYRKSLEIMQLEKGGLLIIADTGRIFQPSPQAGAAGKEFFNSFKDITARKISAGFIPYKKGFKDVTIAWMNDRAEAFKKIYLPKNVTMKHAAYIPEDAEYFMTAQLLLDNSYNMMWKIFAGMGKLPGRIKEINKYLAAIKKYEEELQFDFSEILAALGSECTFAVTPSGSFAVLEIRSRPAFEAYMEQLNIWLEEKAFKKISYRDFTINYMPRTGYPLPFAFSYTIIDDKTMAVALYPHILKKFINNLHNKNFRSIEKNQDYLNLKAETRIGTMFSYTQLKPMAENVYKKAVPLLQMMSAIPLNPIDAGKFPPFESFSDDFFGQIKSSWMIDEGMVQECYSPVGITGDVISALDLYASVLENPAISMLISAAAVERIFPNAAAENQVKKGDADQ